MTDHLTEPPLGGMRAYLQSLMPSLVPSEQRVVRLCIDNPQLVSESSVAELAGHAQTSPATVVRACKSLGLEGFQHLRQILLRDLGAAAWDAARDTELEGLGPGDARHPVTTLFARAAHEIRNALGALDYAAFDAAVASIRSAGRLLVVGNGASLPPAQSIALRFLGSGRVCEAPADVVSQHVAAALLGPGDVCLAVSDSGMNLFTLEAARAAARNGATLIGVTSYGKSALAEISTHALVAGAEFHSFNDETVVGNIVQMLLLSALHTAFGASSAEAAAAKADVLRVVYGMVERAEPPVHE
ncbi:MULTISPECIES: MurR/RpiR family transcriptional regulator [Arthrobacter]|uniref:MurR/RpiR family transcriptional regulator n=2 Tax=Arthrobacter TaxID=1663 RepID=A0ABU9KM18_9MICC|nr:MurR/RpiR family transcriptional regulator [Arthrobacter sp. YJM1]MDP5227611.1 MurR/RpiR family transcriptional regulator [Arthrobacter sp. YJM1]